MYNKREERSTAGWGSKERAVRVGVRRVRGGKVMRVSEVRVKR